MTLLSAICDNPAGLVRLLLLMIAAALLVAVWLTVYMVDHVSPCAGDPMQSAYGDLPGFSREQLEAIARLPIPPHTDAERRSFSRSSAEDVALRSKTAGDASCIPSGVAGDSGKGARRVS